MKNKPTFALSRRNLVTAPLAMGLATVTGATAAGRTGAGAPGGLAHSPDLSLAILRDYRTLKASSFDRSGGNDDWRKVEPGATVELMNAQGPGVISHIWITINARDEQHLKKIVLRMSWDGESQPSVEVPVGDFFGLNLGDYFLYESAMLAVAPVKALNAYFPLPFRQSALVTMQNESDQPIDSLYWNIDYQQVPELPEGTGYFHAQYRQSTPCLGWKEGVEKNPSGTDNYVFVEASGKGHIVGVTQGIVLNQDGWWGEGDDMLFLDGSAKPVTVGTGSEDYYNGAWGFDGKRFDYARIGVPFVDNPFLIGGRWCVYRWHLDAPLAFQKSARFTIEHGTGNDRSDSFSSVAYWYQAEPHAPFPPLPAAALRIPKVFAVPHGAAPAS